MTDELDPDLRRLFVRTAEDPADEAFVAAVVRSTSRERWIPLLAPALATGVAVAVAAAVLAAVVGPIASEAAAAAFQVAAGFSASPLGWAAGLAVVFAGAVYARFMAQLRSWRD